MIILLISCSRQPSLDIQEPESFYFAETGHTVQAEFLFFYNHYGGVDNLGYPLTEEIIADGWRVQYFEKGRLEFHPENEPAYRVTVGWLGDLLHRRRPPSSPASLPRADETFYRYFPQTGHTLRGDFLTYFDKHGGSVRFGLPISEPFLWEGRLTQDFQSARFFWNPDQKTPVALEDIGRIHFEVSGLKENLMEDTSK